MVWLLNVKLTAEQSTYMAYKAMAYWKLETGPQLILRLLRTIRCLEPDKDGHIMVHLQFSKLPFFRPYAMFLFNFSECPDANEPTVRAARGGNED